MRLQAVDTIMRYERQDELAESAMILVAPSATDNAIDVDTLSHCIECVRSGRALVLVDIQHALHPMLTPLLDAQKVRQVLIV